MQELMLKKKKKKMLDLTQVENIEEILEDRIKEAFKGHVGEELAITPYDLFIKIFHKHPEEVDIYKRVFLWNLLMRFLHKMRREKKLFVINKVNHLFVLKTQEESDKFRNRLDRTIEALGRTQDNADEWVQQKKWKVFE